MGSGDDAGAVRREGGAPNNAIVAFQDGDQLSARRVPQPRGFVVGSGDDAGAVRREGGASNIAIVALKSLRSRKSETAAPSAESVTSSFGEA